MQNFIEIIKKNGAKLTKPRKLVLLVLFKNRKPLSLSEIHKLCPQIDFASVYRTVSLFVEIGILQEILLGDKKPKYELETDESHHHHIKCIDCGNIMKLDFCIVDQIEEISNFEITNHTMEFLGVCPKCQSKK